VWALMAFVGVHGGLRRFGRCVGPSNHKFVYNLFNMVCNIQLEYKVVS
jgi:hypothetical protein